MPKLKEFFGDIRAFNKKYKCASLIIFAILYVASPIDLLPELFGNSWLFYLDDMAVLIFAFVITYLEVFYNERNYSNNENVEGVYSAVRRSDSGLAVRRNMGDDNSADSDAVLNALANQIPPAELPTAIISDEPINITDELESIVGPTSEQPTTSDKDTSYYEQHFINSASKSDDCAQQFSELSRPDVFVTGEGNTIIW